MNDVTRETETGDAKAAPTRAGASGMSYKFQRLREKLRSAIASGELSGKLPGERALARRFHVNAKTLSKALTDLAAEGVLDRSIGRGTYVKGCAPATPGQGRWLVLADPEQADSSLIYGLRTVNPELQVATAISDMRPSFLNQFASVIDAASNTPEAFLRDLVVRNMPVVAVNREPKTYSMHSVLLDIALGASRLGRDLMLAGHRRIAAVEPVGSTALSMTLRTAIARYAPDAIVDACTPDEVSSLLDTGVTAIVCGTTHAANKTRAELQKAAISVPGQVSLAAVGCVDDIAPCSGYYCSAKQLADAVVGLLRDAAGTRPATLWLAGAWHDLGTTGPTVPIPVEEVAKLRLGGVLV
ncbi:MAG TPA: GntR family transcriptional regulator [Tepidisphaeraceae bacterium]|nr:GntR family transcriptional regulator [Tepidisphaeraceae bacterium]